MGTPIDVPTYIIGDIQYLLYKTYKPHMSLKNKSSSIEFHFVCEGTSKDEWQTAYINTHSNSAGIIKKSLAGGEKRQKNIGYALHYIN